MGLTARPSKNIDLSKIDNIQEEFFGEGIESNAKSIDQASLNLAVNPSTEGKHSAKEAKQSKKTVKMVKKREETPSLTRNSVKKLEEPVDSIQSEGNTGEKIIRTEAKKANSENLKISDLLATAQFERVRHTSRPYTVPRSLTIDLSRLKSKFRSRDLQYTQNELMDKMLRESLERVTAENYLRLREHAFAHVKSAEQCSRRSVTLTEETVAGMAELKADLALEHGRRFSSDEIFTTLLAIAFLPLYENGLL
jgi:hypothetical protein